MLPDRVSNPGPLIYESGALPIALCGPAPPGEVAPKCDLPPIELNKMCHCTSMRTEYL